jgi:hypothetical protein
MTSRGRAWARLREISEYGIGLGVWRKSRLGVSR